MDILGIFRDFDIASISKYMGIEFIIGAIIGLVIKQLTIFNSRNDSEIQVISAKEYSASYPDKNIPKHPFDLFLLAPEFVILKTEDGVVSRAEFYTFLGTSMRIDYENGMEKYGGGSALTAPIYLCTVVVPSVVGFFPSLLPFIGQYFSTLFYSGLVWMFLTFLLQPFTGMINRVVNNPE